MCFLNNRYIVLLLWLVGLVTLVILEQLIFYDMKVKDIAILRKLRFQKNVFLERSHSISIFNVIQIKICPILD